MTNTLNNQNPMPNIQRLTILSVVSVSALFVILFFGTAFAVGSTVDLVNPIGGVNADGQREGTTSIAVIIGTIIKAALGVAGSLTLATFVYGSFVWLTSAGKAEKIQEGSRTMLYAVIGLFIIFSAYGILNQVITALTR